MTVQCERPPAAPRAIGPEVGGQPLPSHVLSFWPKYPRRRLRPIRIPDAGALKEPDP
jgi:hypothetical protein